MRLDPRADPATARSLWLATGAAWGLTSALLLARPASGDPVTIVDFAAVVAYTAAWLLLAPAIVLVGRLDGFRLTRATAWGIALAAGVAGLANLAGNALDVAGARDVYGAGVLLATVLLVPFAYLFARARATRLAVLVLGVFLGVGLAPAALGGVLVLVLFGALALRTAWFLPEATPRTGAA